MPRCETCGNDYASAFTIIGADGQSHVFDSFECAIHRLAPRCDHCGCRIIGHGIDTAAARYCCASCARHAGVSNAVDNTLTPTLSRARERE